MGLVYLPTFPIKINLSCITLGKYMPVPWMLWVLQVFLKLPEGLAVSRSCGPGGTKAWNHHHWSVQPYGRLGKKIKTSKHEKRRGSFLMVLGWFEGCDCSLKFITFELFDARFWHGVAGYTSMLGQVAVFLDGRFPTAAAPAQHLWFSDSFGYLVLTSNSFR